jgi:hypothetical protein
MGPAFVERLTVEKFHGVGPATAAKMNRLGIKTGFDLREQTLAFLQQHFGKPGPYYYWIARGVDERPLVRRATATVKAPVGGLGWRIPSLGLLQCDKSLLDARGSDSSPPLVGDLKCFRNSDDGHLRFRQAARDRYLAGITTGSRAPDIEARQL